jgi:hypothetical protein
MGYYKNTGFIESKPPRKPIQWKEVVVKDANYEKCIAWCENQLGDEYECWPLGGDRWGSNKGLWKIYNKHKEKGLHRFCFRDEKLRLEAELKFG